MARSNISKTLGPIHFEDLDPHRFEDLIRELAYDFKDWQSIEATGRSGSDEGFDIRAYERIDEVPMDVDNTDSVNIHPMDGRVWMFQCKREKKIGPTKVASIVSNDINSNSPPYGYVLAAPANFSKASYDKFREELRKLGVMEFYLWGCAALEDMLHLPKNDHILFTFFGISLVSKRKSRATEIRSIVNAKNKLLKLFGENPSFRPLLIRDSNDINYPYKTEYKDFKERPRWREYPVVEMHPLGLGVQSAKYFAFYDAIRKEWDFCDVVNLVRRQDDDEDRAKNNNIRQRVENFQEFFQESNQAIFVVKGLVRFDSIVVIDSEGDSLNRFPHIYVDFQGNRGPLFGFSEYLEISKYHYESIEKLKRVKKYPKTFPELKLGTVYRDKTIHLNDHTLAFLNKGSHSIHTVYDCDSRYSFLNPGDVIGVEKSKDIEGNPTFIKLTHKRKEKGKDILKKCKDDPMILGVIEEQIERKVKLSDMIMIYEFKIVYGWQLERYGK